MIRPDLRGLWKKFKEQMAEEKRAKKRVKSVDPRPDRRGRLRKKKVVRARNMKKATDQSEDRVKEAVTPVEARTSPNTEELVTPNGKRKIKKDVNDSPGTFDFEQLDNAEMESEKDAGERKGKAFRRGDPEEEIRVLGDMQIVSDEVERIDRPLGSMVRAVDKSVRRKSRPLDAVTTPTDKNAKKKPAVAARTVGGRRLRMSRGMTADSGAADSVMPRRLLRYWHKIKPHAASLAGVHYVAASDHRIRNEGEGKFPFQTKEGGKHSWTFQIAEMNKHWHRYRQWWTGDIA